MDFKKKINGSLIHFKINELTWEVTIEENGETLYNSWGHAILGSIAAITILILGIIIGFLLV